MIDLRFNMTDKIHFAHLVNPVKTPVYSELSYAQPITFETMRVARERAASGGIQVDLLSAQFPEDHEMVPDCFRKTPDLERSAADFGAFTRPKKLPLLQDLLRRLYEESEAPYLIYTNVDIAIQPHFYLEVAKRFEQGLDALILNRRRIPGHFRSVEELPAMYAHSGAPHPGFDCFVFHRSLHPKFELEKVCVGIPFVEMAMSQNLFCHARNFRLFRHDFLSFHIGMEIFKKRDKEYLQYNRKEFWKAIDKLWPALDSRKFPWGDRNALYRMLRWGLHPAIPIRLALMLEPRRWRRQPQRQ
jgi:hypothetical protein